MTRSLGVSLAIISAPMTFSAVEDKATVPLYYDSRGEKLGIATTDLNEKIAAKLEELDTDDIDAQQRLEGELKRDYHIITAGTRLEAIAQDFVEHYSAAWETGKAMLVCIDKITCVRMHGMIIPRWTAKIAELEATLGSLTDEQEEAQLRRRIEWMRETQIAVVVSEEQGEVENSRSGTSTSNHTESRSRTDLNSRTERGWISSPHSSGKNTRSAFRLLAQCG